ncbi:hypothetical protein C0993_003003, partial [Termitomyces sp. T159_Od127]
SYTIDPKWQVKFTIIWTSVLAFFTLIALPYVFRGYRQWTKEAFGVTENWRDRYTRLSNGKKEECHIGRTFSPPPRCKSRLVARIFSTLGSVFYWTPPGLGLNAGQ